MSVDESQLRPLITESRDLHSDAMRQARASLPDLADLREDRRNEEVDPAETARVNEGRRALADRLDLTGAGAAKGVLAAGGLGALLAAIVASPVAAQKQTDIDILQTASSLEILAVATYDAALQLPFIADGNAVVKTFAQTTMDQHDEHRQAFQAQTRSLGGKKQKNPNPKYAPIVEQAKPTLTGPLPVVDLAATLEEVATETYLANLALLRDQRSKELMASVMAVETQHLGVLRAVRALIQGGAPQLIAIPTDVAALPAAAGSVAFPDALQNTDKASPPAEGAV